MIGAAVLAPYSYSADPSSTVVHGPSFEVSTSVTKDIPSHAAETRSLPTTSPQNSQHRVRRKPTIEYRERKDDIDDIVDGYGGYAEKKTNVHVEGGIEFPKMKKVVLYDRPMPNGSVTLDSAGSSSHDDPGPVSPEQQPVEPPIVMGRHELSKDFYEQGAYSTGIQGDASAVAATEAWNSAGAMESVNALGMDELTGGAFSGSASMAMKMKKPSRANLKAAIGKTAVDGSGLGELGAGPIRSSVEDNGKGISGAMRGFKDSVRSRLNSLTGKKHTNSKDWDHSSDAHSGITTSPPLPTSHSMPYRDYRDAYPQPSEHGHLPRSVPNTAPLNLPHGGRHPSPNNHNYPNQPNGNNNSHPQPNMARSPPSANPRSLRPPYASEGEGHLLNGHTHEGTDPQSWLHEPPSSRAFPHQPNAPSARQRQPAGPRTRGYSEQSPHPPTAQNYTYTRRLASGETGQNGAPPLAHRENMF
ncbi:hypothetical protein FRC17_007487 [Serendipita sp. 399]|nr:hypothetical protein FRC17_007487 [Serendipita sp. 399]